MKDLEKVLRKVRKAGKEAIDKASDILKKLESEGMIRRYYSVEAPEYDISGIDGSYKSVKAFVKPFTIIKVAVVNYTNGTYRIKGGIRIYDEDTGEYIDKISHVFYEEDYFVEEDSVRMLKLEAEAALRELMKNRDFVLIDGPFFNPPPDIRINHQLAEENLNIRKLLAESNAIGVVKRVRKRLITEMFREEVGEASETMLLIKIISILRRDNPEGTIVIGPFDVEVKLGHNVYKLHSRYVSRSYIHKPVVVEVTDRVYREHGFPERIISDKYWIPDYRANIPNVLRMAHEAARIKDEEARNVFSIFYKVLRALEEEDIYGRRCNRLRIKPRKHVRRENRAH